MKRYTTRLNGTWEIKFDLENRGMNEGWAENESRKYDRKIEIPSTWNLIEPEFEGIAFYRKRFAVEPEFCGKKIQLRFGAVNYYAEVWINGIMAGTHEGGYTPFTFDITPFIRYSPDNILVVRVIDPPNDGSGREVEGLRHMEIPSGKESWYVNFSGIWQDVELIITENTYIKDVFVFPDLKKGMVRVRMTVYNDVDFDGAVEFKITTPDGVSELARQIRPVILDQGTNIITLDVPFGDYRLWTIEEPVLYLLTARLAIKNITVDDLSTTFGMRSFEMKNNSFYLNGKRIILRGLLHQQQYPKNLAYPESKEEARRIVRLLKEGGWNLLRIHIRPTTPAFLDVCDEEGMLIFEEPAVGWIVESDRLRDRAFTEVRDMVQRDHNHPSVVIWGILNESGVRGAPDILGRTKMYWNQGELGIQKLKPDLARIIRDEDPSRFITDDSGATTCNYYLPESYEPVNYYDNHLYMSYPLSHAGFEVFRNLGRTEDFFHSHQFESFPLNHRITGGSPEKLFIQSEFGCGGIPLWPEVLPTYDDHSGVTYRDEAVYRRIDGLLRDYYDRELADVFPTYEDALRETQRIQALSVRRMIEALRSNPLAAGYIYTQLHDNDYECNAGILDPIFRPKLAYNAAQEANRPLRIVLETYERVVYQGGEFIVTVYLVNDTGIFGHMEMELTVTAPDGKLIRNDWLRVQVREGIQEMYTMVVREANREGIYTTRASLFADEKMLDTALYTNQVLSPFKDTSQSVTSARRTSEIRKAGGPASNPQPFYLVAFKGKVQDWLEKNSVKFKIQFPKPGKEGTPSEDDTDFYVVEPMHEEKDLTDNRIAPVLEHARRGATVLFLGLPVICLSDEDEKLQELREQGKYICWCSPAELETDTFGFRIQFIDSKPRFVGPYHYFKKHPVFDGLDAGHILDDRFSRIMPFSSLRIEGAETLGGVFGTPVGYHFKIKGCEHARDPRFGADLCIVQYEKGKLIFSTYQLEQNLGKDPVADRILWNMLREL
ncbi:MAG: glycoside hydrolase family 2 TIM barrel-domain containing protein [Candidatus Latescibacter sp.]|nr:glycoside hydrolase family 2 TIM barrel-domain containing protein [Candidatus Latescibacter sp.]